MLARGLHFLLHWSHMNWATRRRSLYISIIVVFAAALSGVPIYYLFFTDVPTCSDGRKNQDELGVDCGGGCERLCAIQIRTPAVLWSRSFKVKEGTYNAVAYIENSNFDAGVDSIDYVFQLFDDRNVIVAERRGKTFLTTNGLTPIFEAGIDTGNRVPVRTFFEFRSDPWWRKAQNAPGYTVSETHLTIKDNGLPRVDAIITNDTVSDIRDIEAVATIFGIDGNAMASSQTTIPLLGPRKSAALVFTWPTPLPGASSRVDVIPRVPLIPNKK